MANMFYSPIRADPFGKSLQLVKFCCQQCGVCICGYGEFLEVDCISDSFFTMLLFDVFHFTKTLHFLSNSLFIVVLIHFKYMLLSTLKF